MRNAQAEKAMADLPGVSDAVLDALPHPVISVAPTGFVVNANAAAEAFFEAGAPVLRRHRIHEIVPFGSPLIALIEQVRTRNAAVNEYRVDLGTPRNGRHAARADDGRQDRPAAHASRCGALSDGTRFDARA
jgi:two-component system nitrogen regulation sensor histidine kinase GlnL